MIKITKFESAEHLRSSEEISAYLAAAFETGELEAINVAIGTAAKARGMADIAKKTAAGGTAGAAGGPVGRTWCGTRPPSGAGDRRTHAGTAGWSWRP